MVGIVGHTQQQTCKQIQHSSGAEEDLVNALAAYSYGYGWLDAGGRMGVLETDEDSTLFTQ